MPIACCIKCKNYWTKAYLTDKLTLPPFTRLGHIAQRKEDKYQRQTSSLQFCGCHYWDSKTTFPSTIHPSIKHLLSTYQMPTYHQMLEIQIQTDSIPSRNTKSAGGVKQCHYHHSRKAMTTQCVNCLTEKLKKSYENGQENFNDERVRESFSESIWGS